MSIEIITILLLLLLMILLGSGLPLAWSLGATSVIFCLVLFSPAVMVMLVSRIFNMMLSYSLIAVPLFILMATLLQQSGVAEDLFAAVHIWSGSFRGGLAIGTILSSTIMAAMVGIVGAEIVTFGLIALPTMLEKKYDHRIAIGSICAGGGMATLIPPSIVFIVYALTCGVSVGELFIAGIMPGLMLSMMFVAYIVIVCWLNPKMAPEASAKERDIPFAEKVKLLKGLVAPFLLAFAVLGSIYAGVATPSEAAGIGCIGSIVAAIVNKKFTFKGFKKALYETVKVSCMLTWLFFGAQAIIGVFTLAGGDELVRSLIYSLPGGKWGIIIGMQLILIFLGLFLDWIGIVLLTMPLFVPVVIELGFSPIWFGVVFCMNMQISYLSPPFGPSIFYLKSVVGDDIPVTTIYKANFPFLVLAGIALIITVAFPSLTLWLPAMMGGGH